MLTRQIEVWPVTHKSLLQPFQRGSAMLRYLWLPSFLKLLMLSRIRPVSVVVTCRNYGRYLREAFISSLNQTRRPKEIIVVDDASVDSTPDVAKRLFQEYRNNRGVKVQYIRNTIKLGAAEARNVGIRSATSEYVMVLDADDQLHPLYIERVASLLDENPQAAIAYSSYREFGDRNRVVTLPPFDPVVLLTDCIIMGCAMFRKSIWQMLGGYDPNQIFEDWELWIRIVTRGWKALGTPEPLYFYRVHGGSKDAEANRHRLEGERRIYEKHIDAYKAAGVKRLETGEWQNARVVPPYR